MADPDRVMVTGVSGMLGGHLALGLLKAGYAVRGSVRSLRRADSVKATLARAGGDLDRLELVALDLGEDAGWEAAMRGCRYLQHVASPLVVEMPRDPQVLVRPAVEGTRRALTAALEGGVERMVVTSSAAAVMYGYPPDRTEPFTEADWSLTTGHGVTPYRESKTRAELEAWAVMEAAGRRGDLAAINPSLILGPLLNDDPGTSAVTILRLLNGAIPAAARITINIVDVRDVVALHIAAMTRAEAGGRRFLASAGNVSILETAQILRGSYPEYARRLPRFEVPDWLVRASAWTDPQMRGQTGLLGTVRTLDSSAAGGLLGRPFISQRLAVLATAKSLIEHGLVKP